MENKEKKQMLTTELTKEKSGRSAGMIQDMSINGIKLHLAQNGTGGPVIFWGMYPHQQNEVEHLWESLLELVPEQNFLLVAFQVEDWNRDFSQLSENELPQQTVPLTSGIRLTQKNLIHLLLNTQRRHNSFKIKTRQDAFLFTGTYPAWFF